MKPPSLIQRNVIPWSTEQVHAVVTALPQRYGPVALVATGCGLRQGEAFGLAVEAFDPVRRRLVVSQQIKVV